MVVLYWMLCVLIGIVPAYLVYRKDRNKDIPARWLPAALRFLTFFGTAALLLAPAFSLKKNEVEKPLLIWLQDESTSFAGALRNDTQQYRQKVDHLLNDLGKDYTVVSLGFSGDVTLDQAFNFNGRSTNIAAAIQSVSEQYQDRNIGAIMLSSDGIYNEGLDPLYLPVSNNIPIYTIAAGDSAQPEDIRVARIFSNKTVASGSVFEVIADLRADKLQGLNTAVGLYQNGKAIKQYSIGIDKDRYAGSVRFEVKAAGKGIQQFSIAVPKANGEPNVHNNKMDFFVNVIDEEIRILILAHAPHPDIAAIRTALETVPQYKIDVRLANAFPKDVEQYNVVIAHQTPSVVPGTMPKVPVWYIAGSQSNINVINQLQQISEIIGNGSSGNVLPVLNPGFSYFTLPQQIREVLAKMPPLLRLSGNYTQAGSAQALLRQSDGKSPLWAVQTGTMPQALLAGEGLWRWRIYEYKNFRSHEVVDELIRQTVSLLSVHKDREPFHVYLDKYVLNDNEQVYVNAELRNANAELVNTPEAKLILKDSTGKTLVYNFEKTGTSYRINLGLLAPGGYTFRGTVSFNGREYSSMGSFMIERIPLESLRTYADYGMLYQLAQKSGGAFFTQNNFVSALPDSIRKNATIAPVIHTHESHEALINQKWLFFLILLFAASEWLLRKYQNI